jgi:hypothetical protein
MEQKSNTNAQTLKSNNMFQPSMHKPSSFSSLVVQSVNAIMQAQKTDCYTPRHYHVSSQIHSMFHFSFQHASYIDLKHISLVVRLHHILPKTRRKIWKLYLLYVASRSLKRLGARPIVHSYTRGVALQTRSYTPMTTFNSTNNLTNRA